MTYWLGPVVKNEGKSSTRATSSWLVVDEYVASTVLRVIMSFEHLLLLDYTPLM